MVAFHESAFSDAHVAIETRRDGDEKEREYVGAREKQIQQTGNGEREKERGDENEARSYFRVTVALPSVSRHRLCASRCILLTHCSRIVYIYVCVCVRCIYIWPEGGESGFGALAGIRACIRPYVCLSARVCTCSERVSGSGGFIIRHRPPS